MWNREAGGNFMKLQVIIIILLLTLFATTAEAALVSWWKMDEPSWSGAAGEVIDSNGSNHGRAYGGATTKVGIDNRAGSFDGSNDYVNVPYNSTLVPSTITLSAWVKANTFGNWNGVVSNKSDASHGINLQMGTIQKIAALVGDGSAYDYVKTSWTPQTGIWYHIVITHDSDTNLNILYVNGKEEARLTRGISYTANQVTEIGRFYTGNNSLFFDGLIDDVKIYNHALTAVEVAQEYALGSKTRIRNVTIRNATIR